MMDFNDRYFDFSNGKECGKDLSLTVDYIPDL
jgi:hypothetical protein